MNSFVPSSGSTTQTRRFRSRSAESAVSSESQPSAGKAAATSARMHAFASRSARVTGLSGPFSATPTPLS